MMLELNQFMFGVLGKNGNLSNVSFIVICISTEYIRILRIIRLPEYSLGVLQTLFGGSLNVQNYIWFQSTFQQDNILAFLTTSQ